MRADKTWVLLVNAHGVFPSLSTDAVHRSAAFAMLWRASAAFVHRWQLARFCRPACCLTIVHGIAKGLLAGGYSVQLPT